MSNLREIVSFLDQTLNVSAFEDISHNGLQVENSGSVNRICVGVDASMAFFEEAHKRKADLLICHHGLSWGDSLKRITGLNYNRLKFLFSNDIALYACHLPLDAHPELGNNAQICKALGLTNLQPFGDYRGVPIGYKGELPESIPYSAFKDIAGSVFGNIAGTMDFGKQTVRTVGVVSGGAADIIEEAGVLGLDVFISGEPELIAWHPAQELGINAVFGGHYATETFGVKAVADLVSAKFNIPAEFVNMHIPF